MRETEFSFSRWGTGVNRFQWMRKRGFGLSWLLLAGGFALAQGNPAAVPGRGVGITGAASQVAPGGAREEMPDRIIVLFRTSGVPEDMERVTAARGAVVAARLESMGMAVVNAAAGDGEGLRQQMAARADVAYAVHDRVLHGAVLRTRAAENTVTGVGHTAALPDGYYTASAQDWAVKQAGGYGHGVPGGAATGPWDRSMGKGVTIALLDSGVDVHHPDIAPNLVSASSLVDQTALPSACDDGSPQDQAGHGTWAASLAAAAMGPHTGMMVGVAPQASIVSIKVLERVPAGGTGPVASLCNAGGTGGLLSWMVTGIASATAAHADVISISAGALLDTWSGYDAGQIAVFNRATYQATQAGAVIVAALGNDGEDLDGGRYVEMPAQATGVLPVMAVTNPACAQNMAAGAVCRPGPVGMAYYSNYGSAIGAIAAAGGSYPQAGVGNGVTGFVRGACSMGLPGLYGCFDQGPAQYVEAIGTSAAAPLVAGAAALLKGANPKLTGADITAILRAEAGAGSGLPVLNTASAFAAIQ